jgi:hypothetical protein
MNWYYVTEGSFWLIFRQLRLKFEFVSVKISPESDSFCVRQKQSPTIAKSIDIFITPLGGSDGFLLVNFDT